MTDMATTSSTRSDAVRNRERIIATASTCFATEGVECQVSEIAKRAGLGNATVFRHFPSKSDLIVAVMRRRLQELVDEVREAAEGDDPGAALDRVVDAIGTMLVRDAALKQIAQVRFEGDAEMLAARDELFACIAGLVARAKAAGQVRADLEPIDLVLMLNGMCTAVGALEVAHPGVWRRYLNLLMSSVRPRDDAAPLVPAAPTIEDFDRAYGR